MPTPLTATLIELVPYDPVAGATVTLRACSADDALLTSLNGVTWWPAIARRPRLTVDLFDGNFSGQISTGAGDVTLGAELVEHAAVSHRDCFGRAQGPARGGLVPAL